jgi:hypothetical protein
VVALKKGGTKLVISNLDDEAYPPEEYDTDPKQVVGVALLHRLQAGSTLAVSVSSRCNPRQLNDEHCPLVACRRSTLISTAGQTTSSVHTRFGNLLSLRVSVIQNVAAPRTALS